MRRRRFYCQGFASDAGNLGVDDAGSQGDSKLAAEDSKAEHGDAVPDGKARTREAGARDAPRPQSKPLYEGSKMTVLLFTLMMLDWQVLSLHHCCTLTFD